MEPETNGKSPGVTRRYLELPAGRLSYIDEGAGPTILMLHGTPSFSFEFEVLIQSLRRSHRIIAPDYLGFGYSARPENFPYTLGAHTESIEALLAHLDLHRFSLMMHDCGGLIGTPIALKRRLEIQSLIILNSWCWPMQDADPKFKNKERLLGSAFMRYLYLNWNFSARSMVRMSWGSHRPLTRSLHKEFIKMFPDAKSRRGTWGFVRSLLDEQEYAASIRDRLAELAGIPTILFWGMADKFIVPAHKELWERYLTPTSSLELEDVGHFPQIEAPDLILPPLQEFLDDAVA